jgi:adenine-specific DNA methylase
VIRLLKITVPYILQGYRRGHHVKNDPDPYKPYEGIPDTPRNRLLTFIARWSPEWIAFEKGENGTQPKPAEMLDDRCLVKWETSDPENEQGQAVLKIVRELVRIANRGNVSTLLDPFAGGGAIPLEATRLGCQAIANDYNPVAYLILRATCEFPQRFGKPQSHRATEEDLVSWRLGDEKEISNRLSHDVEQWARWILERARERIGHLYPAGKDGKPVVGYLWARTAPCSNPACRAEIPLLRSLLVCNKSGKRVALTMTVDGKDVNFGVARVGQVGNLPYDGTMLNRGDCRCPICQQTTPVEDLRRAGLEGKMSERMVAVITDTPEGKDYRPVEPTDLEAFEEAKRLAEKVERPSEPILPEITGNDDEDISNSTGIRVHLYGMKTWGSLFNPRQLMAMQTFIACLRDALAELEKHEPDADYRKAVAAYLGLWVSRNAMRMTTMGRWDTGGEKFQTPFDMAKIAMVWDFPEANPFSDVTGGFSNQLNWILRFIMHESPRIQSSIHHQVLRGDAARLPLNTASADVVVTDPPYYDEIAYADLSDLFYVWLKRGLSDVLPEVFATPLTPKGGEATALKHRHGGNAEKAEQHFTSKLAACFREAKRTCKPDGVFAVMFAHQTTEAWTALINALFEAGLNVTATYPMDTELKNRARGLGSSALESSITVVCRPRQVGAAAAFRDVRREIERVVAESVHRFWNYGFRGADLIVACYGPAVGVFGRYERVERADGTPVSVPELLELVKESALKAIAGEFTGDALSRLYFVWANLYGTSEQAWDDARLVVQIGGDSEDAMTVARQRGLFVVDGAKCRLALLRDRADRRNLGEDASALLIDQLHHAMRLWKEERRGQLVNYLRDHDLFDHAPFWKLAQALFEVLPHGEEDWKLVSALLGERETLRLEARRSAPTAERTLFDQ